MIRSVLLLLGLSACVVRLSVDESTIVTCNEQSPQCPEGFRCELSLGRCVLPGFTVSEPPVLNLAFSSPRQGELQVARLPRIIIAFDRDVEAASLLSAVSLTDSAGQSVILASEDTGLANTFILVPTQALAGEADYTLAISSSVQPLDAAVASNATGWTIQFRTVAAPDTQPPGPVANVVVDTGTNVRTLTFTNPNDADFTGVLIVRALGHAAIAEPENGVIYSGGTNLGNARVAGTTSEGVFADLVGASEDVDYLLFPFDVNANYGPPVHPPRLTSGAVRWCPDETLSGVVDSPDVATAELQVRLTANEAYDAATVPSELRGTLGSTLVAPAALAPSGSTRFVRNVVHGLGGIARGLEQAVVLRSSTVVITPSLSTVGVGGAVSAAIDQAGWPGVEVAIDGDSAPNQEGNWTTLAVGPSGMVSYAFSTEPAGGYRFRARPVVVGCPSDGAFSLSAVVTVGSVLYVRPSGSDAASGADPVQAKATIAAAVAVATPNTEVRVAEGTYEERLVLSGKNLTLNGGFDATFGSYNSVTHPTLVTLHVGATMGDEAPTVTIDNAEVHLIGMTFDYDGQGMFVAHETLFAGTNARVYLDNVTVLAPRVMSETHALKALGATFVQARESVFRLRAGSSPTSFVRTLRFSGEDLVVEQCRFEGSTNCSEVLGIQVDRGRADLHGNVFAMDGCNERIGISCVSVDPNLASCRSVGNDITLGSGASANGIGIQYGDVRHEPGFRSLIVANRIFGLSTGVQARGIIAHGPTVDLEIANNVVHAGHALDTAALSLGGDINAMVTHNLFIAGGAGGSQSSAVLLTSPAPSNFANNILATSGNNTERYCVREAMANADPMAFVSNLLFACPTALYLNETANPMTDLALINGLSGSGLDWPVGCTGACESSRFSANAAPSGAQSVATFFSDPDGSDNDFSTMADNDYLFAFADAFPRFGGVDPLDPNCGTQEAPRACLALPQPLECGTRGCDYFTALRTCTGPGECTSFGPFEQDTP